jgi:hypothetical protein
MNEKIEIGQLLIISENKFIKNLPMSFYIKSASSELMTISIIDEKLFGNRLNGERLILPFQTDINNYQEGEVVRVDALKTIIESFESTESVELTLERKLLNRDNGTQKQKNNSIDLPNLRDEKILIIGAVAMGSAYVNAFREIGYAANVISGFEKTNKLMIAGNKHDKIIFLTECASHKNFHMLKSNFKSKLILVSETGVSRIIEAFKGNQIG